MDKHIQPTGLYKPKDPKHKHLSIVHHAFRFIIRTRGKTDPPHSSYCLKTPHKRESLSTESSTINNHLNLTYLKYLQITLAEPHKAYEIHKKKPTAPPTYNKCVALDDAESSFLY